MNGFVLESCVFEDWKCSNIIADSPPSSPPREGDLNKGRWGHRNAEKQACQTKPSSSKPLHTNKKFRVGKNFQILGILTFLSLLHNWG